MRTFRTSIRVPDWVDNKEAQSILSAYIGRENKVFSLRSDVRKSSMSLESVDDGIFDVFLRVDGGVTKQSVLDDMDDLSSFYSSDNFWGREYSKKCDKESKMSCPECGSIVSTKDTECHSCGAKLPRGRQSRVAGRNKTARLGMLTFEPGMRVRKIERRGVSAATGLVLFVDQNAQRVAVRWPFGTQREDPIELVVADDIHSPVSFNAYDVAVPQVGQLQGYDVPSEALSSSDLPVRSPSDYEYGNSYDMVMPNGLVASSVHKAGMIPDPDGEEAIEIDELAECLYSGMYNEDECSF